MASPLAQDLAATVDRRPPGRRDLGVLYGRGHDADIQKGIADDDLDRRVAGALVQREQVVLLAEVRQPATPFRAP